MSITSRLDKIEKYLKSTSGENGERFFIVEISQEQTVFNVQYKQTRKDGKFLNENIPSVEGLNRDEYEEYKKKYMNEKTLCIVDDKNLWED